MHVFESAIGTIEWTEEATGVLLRFGGREHRLVWETVGGAGTVILDEAGTPAARYLVIAPGIGFGYLLRLPIPDGVTEASALVDTLRAHLAERWLGDLPPEDYKRPFAPPDSTLPAWLAPAAILLFIAASAILIFACLGFSLIQAGEWQLFSWQFGLGFVVWFAIVGAVMYAYRRAWLRK